MSSHLNRLNETVQMRGYNIRFQQEITKIIIKYSLLSGTLKVFHICLPVIQSKQLFGNFFASLDNEALPDEVYALRKEFAPLNLFLEEKILSFKSWSLLKKEGKKTRIEILRLKCAHSH